MARNNVLLACVALAFASSSANGQVDVTPTGRLLDANPALGGNGANFARPVSPLMRGNLTASGNVRGGLGLRSFSPIGDPSSFHASLGSGALSGFVRDSVGIGDAYNPRSLYSGITPYYDPSSTAPTGAFLQRQGAYHTPFAESTQRGSSALLPGQMSFAAPTLSTPNPFGDRGSNIGADSEAPWQLSLSSTVFGVQPLTPDQPDALSLPKPDAYDSEFTHGAINTMPGMDQTNRETNERWLPLDFRLPMPALEDQPTNPTDAALHLNPTQLLAERATHMEPAWTSTTQQPQGATQQIDHSLVPGQNVFTDMRMALSLREDPGAPWFHELRDAMRNDPTATDDLREAVSEQSDAFVKRMMDTPITTFVGKGKAPVNDTMLRAESLMDAGEYREAALEYERASVYDPVNPLPLIGQAHAHLAAGEYLSASYALERGLERFPDLAKFKVNLESLMGGGEIVDIRRADLAELLKRNDNPRLRFLLGYIEVQTGNVKYGMENLDKAAAAAEFGSFIRRYPTLLRQAGIGSKPAPSESDKE